MDNVLVVGGRTTGLMMALELARRGVATRCIDQSPGIDPHVRANLLHSRTLEIFQGLGLDEAVTSGSVPETGYAFYRDGNYIGDNPHAPVDSPFPFGMSQSQAHTERVLESALNGYGVQVERSVGLTSIEPDADGVTVSLRHGDQGDEAARFGWVIGCDGAHSAVRKHLGIGFPGDPDDIPYILGDVMVEGGADLEPDKGHVFFHDDGELFLFTRLPHNRQFIVANLARGARADGQPTLDDLQAIVTERSGRPLALRDPHWLGYFRINYRLADHYRQGRVFLAGDAAHIHSPMAGQGMNIGIQDALNLAWKLALVVEKKARESLLDSYESERREVDRGVVDFTRQMTETLETYPFLAKEEQETFIAHLFTPEEMRLEQDRYTQEIATDYADSPLTLIDNDGFTGGPNPGTRAPNAQDLTVAGKPTTLFQIPADAQYRLFLFCGGELDPGAPAIRDAADAAKRLAGWLTPYIVSQNTSVAHDHGIILDAQGEMHRIYAAHSPCIYLIRADGYVAYRSFDLMGVETYFQQVAAFADALPSAVG